MNKKNIFIYFLLALPLLLTSCLKDQEDLFTDSASARTTKYLAEVQDVLTSAENGWLLNYYPDREQSYGGAVYTLQFDDEQVTVASEIAGDPNYTETSTYILNNEDGPVLMFDTYNQLMHYFATPSGSSGAGGYEAYDGDFIFIILGISEDKNTITLKGNRSGNIMYMHRMTESSSSYITKVMQTQETMPINYTFESEGETVKIALSNGRANFSSESVDESTAYIYTSEGVEFYEPVVVNDVVIEGIKNNGEAEYTTAIGSDLQLKSVFLPINEILISSDLYFSYDNMSAFAQTAFLNLKTLSDSEGEAISTVELVNTGGQTGYGIYFISGRYAGFMGFDYELIGENQIKLIYNDTRNNGNGNWYYGNGYNGFVSILDGHTFTLTVDSRLKPSYFILTDNDNADCSMKLTISPAAPFNY